MEPNGFSVQHGAAYGSNGRHMSNGTDRSRLRPPTVEEALPYSPFSSVVPFNSDIIPIPRAGLRSSASLFSSTSDRDEARRGLESLNQEASDPYTTSQKLQQTLHDLKQLLHPDKIAQFNFKIAPLETSESQSNKPPEVSLSPFAKMVYDSTNPDYTYPSPVPSIPSPKETPIRVIPQKRKTQPKPQPKLVDRAVANHVPQPHPQHTAQNSAARALPQQAGQVIRSSVPQQLSPRQANRTLPNHAELEENSSITVDVLNTKLNDDNDTITVEVSSRKPKPQIVTPQQPLPARKISSIAVEIPSYDPQSHSSYQTPATGIPQITTLNTPQTTPLATKVKHQIAPQTPPQPGSEASGLALKLAVVIGPSPRFRPEDYEVLPDSPDTPLHLSRKRRRSEGFSDDDLSMSLDQREKADLAFRALRDQIQEIFEAEDQLQPDTILSSPFFVSSGEGVSLAASTQTKVESLLQKIILIGRFSQVPVDDLLRVQKLSEGAVKEAENIDLKVNDGMGDADIETWRQNISIADLGLRSARTSLRMMSGGREDKQLYSEGITQAALNAFKNAMDYCIVPVVEMRSSGSTASLFKLLSLEKKAILSLLTQCRRLLSLFATLVSDIELSETVTNALEFTVSRLVFVENAHAEKDSILGVAKFDALRVVAMDVLSQIFLNKPSQRQGIFDDILTSLEKLPVTKQSARQFKLAEGGSIQHVSALIMRLVQTSANKSDDMKEKRRNEALEALNDGDEAAQGKQLAVGGPTITSESRAEEQTVTAIQELQATVSPLLETAKANAGYVVNFIVTRASKSSKTGDAPYRHLLDLFVEDFILCLSSTDWPAAELLLRFILIKMVQLAEGEKTAGPAKNMALDVLGSMGAAISELISQVRKIAGSLENSDTDLGNYMSRLAEASLEKKGSLVDLVSWSCGPYRTSVEFLFERRSLDPQLSSAVGFYVAEWASKICATYDATGEEEDNSTETEREYGRLAYRLRMMIGDTKWLSTEYSFEAVNAPHARLAHAVTLLHSPFCESFSRVLSILLGSMSNDQAQVRSKSLKSVTTVLETDPTILDREPIVMHRLTHCMNDHSSLVRDSALSLVGRCISLRPALEGNLIPNILQRVSDAGVGVRKRAMKLSKDIYLRNTKPDVRSSIADSLLHRVTDLDDSVQELARQTIEDVWMSPFYQPTSSNDTSAQIKLAMADHVALLVRTIQRGGTVSTVLDKVLQNMLSDKAKFSAANFRVCKALVATMFDTIIDNSTSGDSSAPSARDALQVLTIFAKSNARLFTPEQIHLLQPHVANVGGNDDLVIFRSVVIIFRHVLPQLSKGHNSFLASVRKDLMPSVSRMTKSVLDDVVACVWIISDVLDDFQNIARLVISSLTGISKTKGLNLSEPKNAEHVRRLNRLLLIAGMFGKHCNLDRRSEDFRSTFPAWKSNSVSELMTDTFASFASPGQPLEVRKAALDAMGMVCQSWPQNFAHANVWTQFQASFEEDDIDWRMPLETISMKTFRDFLLLEEKRSETDGEAIGAGADPAATLGVMGGSHGDGIALGIAQRFLKPVIRIALSREDEEALLATEVMGCIIRQGLMHPKECATSLVALETSQNPKIAEIAFRQHLAMHVKNESILEKEYMRAVQLAYTYQRDVIKNINGATLNPFSSKLHMFIDVLKISKVKNRKKFYENLCSRIDFDPEKMSIENLPEHLELSQFIIENMAFFEYVTVEELLGAIAAMERVVAGTGTSIAHAIETEILHISVDQPPRIDEHSQTQLSAPEIDMTRLQKLTASSMMLSSLWEARTYLRRQYGLKHSRSEGKGKNVIKDLNKVPTKAQGVTGDKFWTEVSSIMDSLESRETMIQQCRSFVELLNVDQDFKIAAEGDDDEARLTTPSDDEENGTPGPPGGSGRGRKRKASGTPGGGGIKKRARSSSAQPRSRGRPKGIGKKQHNGRGSVDIDDEGSEQWE